MFKPIVLILALLITVPLTIAEEQVTIQKVTLTTPSGTISGKVIGTGDKLVFVDDKNPNSSFTLSRGEIQRYRAEDGAIIVEMARPATDRAGTVSNLRITLVDPASSAVLTKWIDMPVERSRTVTTHSVDVRHDHKGEGHCNGKLLADDTTLRFESVTEANHSRSWNYNDLQSFEEEKDHALVKVKPKSGDTERFKVTNGATAGALYDLVAQKIVAARPVQ